MSGKHGSDNRYRIRAVERALELMEAFSIEEPELSLKQLSGRLELNASTVFRLLATLQARGYVEHSRENGRYRLGPACLGPSSVYLAQADMRRRLTPLLVTLRDDCRETVHLATLDRKLMEVIYLEKLEGLLPIGLMGSRVGGRSPAYCTGLGKAMLAHEPPEAAEAFYQARGLPAHTPQTITAWDVLSYELAEIRRRGYALDNTEHEPDVKCVAAPVWNHRREVAGAISVAGPAERIEKLIAEKTLIDTVKVVAARASELMGCPGANRRQGGEGV
ncbi:MAG: IclR family transcriptional regulator [Anaerolineae bacterium]|jgi:DNA-binding IclR family transcriptional regulator